MVVFAARPRHSNELWPWCVKRFMLSIDCSLIIIKLLNMWVASSLHLLPISIYCQGGGILVDRPPYKYFIVRRREEFLMNYFRPHYNTRMMCAFWYFLHTVCLVECVTSESPPTTESGLKQRRKTSASAHRSVCDVWRIVPCGLMGDCPERTWIVQVAGASWWFGTIVGWSGGDDRRDVCELVKRIIGVKFITTFRSNTKPNSWPSFV